MPLILSASSPLDISGDALIFPAEASPCAGSGLSAVIYQSAGPDKLLKLRRLIGTIPQGKTGVTPAFSLPYKFLIHTVFPRPRLNNIIAGSPGAAPAAAVPADNSGSVWKRDGDGSAAETPENSPPESSFGFAAACQEGLRTAAELNCQTAVLAVPYAETLCATDLQGISIPGSTDPGYASSEHKIPSQGASVCEIPQQNDSGDSLLHEALSGITRYLNDPMNLLINPITLTVILSLPNKAAKQQAEQILSVIK